MERRKSISQQTESRPTATPPSQQSRGTGELTELGKWKSCPWDPGRGDRSVENGGDSERDDDDSGHMSRTLVCSIGRGSTRMIGNGESTMHANVLWKTCCSS